jgi:hypothetical protein
MQRKAERDTEQEEQTRGVWTGSYECNALLHGVGGVVSSGRALHADPRRWLDDFWTSRGCQKVHKRGSGVGRSNSEATNPEACEW